MNNFLFSFSDKPANTLNRISNELVSLKRGLLFALPLFFCLLTFGQDGLPVIVLSNGAAATGNAWVVDPDSLQGNSLTFITRTMVLTGPSGSRFGIFLDSLRRGSDYDSIIIHDGNSVSSPILTYYTGHGGGSQPPISVKTSSDVVTIYYRANGATSPGRGWRLGLRTITDPGGELASFLPIFQHNLWTVSTQNGMMDAADYDNDNDMDILVNGIIFQNIGGDDSMYVFNRKLQPIGSWTTSSMVGADFNNDGFKDIFITGESTLGGPASAATTALFRNNGDNTFTRIVTPNMPNAGRGCSAIADINGDGRPDVVYSASTTLIGSGSVFKIFLNNGNFSFIELPNNLPGLMSSSMDWFDYDGDGDPDVVMNGYNGTGAVVGLFKNNGGGTFTKVSISPLYTSSGGQMKWMDANGDGRMDFINTGVMTPGNTDGIIPELLINNGNDNFTRLITNLPARSQTHLDSYDYDGDGDADLIYGGMDGSVITTDAVVYKNNGDGSFTRMSYRPGAQCLSTVKWTDLNSDNRKDLFICGRTDFDPSYVLLNMGADSFRVASYPFVSYTNTFGQNVLVEDLNNDGLPDFTFAGPLDDQDCAEGNSSTLIFSEGWKRKPFTGFTKVFDLRSIPGSNVTENSYWRWGDVDNDGKKDVILTNHSEPLRIFKNNGGNNFSLLYSGMINSSKSYDQCGVVDIDNDGKNELYVTPNKLYKWTGSGFSTLYEDFPIGCEGQSLSSCDGYFDFADYNNDGFTDVVFAGGGGVYILRNNRAGRFVNDYPGSFTSLGPGSYGTEVRWIDYDGDGDQDLVTRNGIFENTSWGGFRYRGEPLQNFGNIAFADFNKDDKIDVLCFNPPNSLAPGHIYYNQGNSFFQDLTPPNFIKAFGSTIFNGFYVSDFDNDGDPDIAYGTQGDCTFSGVYLNRASEIYRNIAVLRPNGGEVYSTGTTLPIRWTGHLLSNTVKVELSVDGGVSYTTLAASASNSADGGVYNWSINSSPSSRCYIRITDNGPGSLKDTSNLAFTIGAATAVSNIIRTDGMRIFPNPANDIVYCTVKNGLPGTKVAVRIFDMTGRELYGIESSITAGKTVTVPIDKLSAGCYIVQVKSNAAVYLQKLVKAR